MVACFASSAGVEGADPAGEAVGADGIFLLLVLPELDLDFLDFVPGDDIRHIKEVLQYSEGNVGGVVDVNGAGDDRAQRAHHGHAVVVVMGFDADVSLHRIELLTVNSDGGICWLSHSQNLILNPR